DTGHVGGIVDGTRELRMIHERIPVVLVFVDRRVAHALLPTHRVADTPRQVLVRRPGQQLRLAGRGPPRPRGVLVEVPRRNVELAAREIALVAVDGLEAGAAVSGRDAVAKLAAVERRPGGGADRAVGKVAALAV